MKLWDIRRVCDPVQLHILPQAPVRCSIIHKPCCDFGVQQILASVVQFSTLFFLDTLTNHSNLFFVSFSEDTYVNWCWCIWHSKQVLSFEWACSWSNHHQQTLFAASLKCKLWSRFVKPLVCSVLKRKMEFWVFVFFVVRNNKTNNKKRILSLYSCHQWQNSNLAILNNISQLTPLEKKNLQLAVLQVNDLVLSLPFFVSTTSAKGATVGTQKVSWDHCLSECHVCEGWWMQSTSWGDIFVIGVLQHKRQFSFEFILVQMCTVMNSSERNQTTRNNTNVQSTNKTSPTEKSSSKQVTKRTPTSSFQQNENEKCLLWLALQTSHSFQNQSSNQIHKDSPQTSSQKFNHKFENHTIRAQTTFCQTKTTSRSQQAFDGLQSPHKINIMCTPHKSRMGQTKQNYNNLTPNVEHNRSNTINTINAINTNNSSRLLNKHTQTTINLNKVLYVQFVVICLSKLAQGLVAINFPSECLSRSSQIIQPISNCPTCHLSFTRPLRLSTQIFGHSGWCCNFDLTRNQPTRSSWVSWSRFTAPN